MDPQNMCYLLWLYTCVCARTSQSFYPAYLAPGSSDYWCFYVDRWRFQTPGVRILPYIFGSSRVLGIPVSTFYSHMRILTSPHWYLVRKKKDKKEVIHYRVLLKRRPKNEDLRPKTPWTKTKTLWTKTKTLWTKMNFPGGYSHTLPIRQETIKGTERAFPIYTQFHR